MKSFYYKGLKFIYSKSANGWKLCVESQKKYPNLCIWVFPHCKKDVSIPHSRDTFLANVMTLCSSNLSTAAIECSPQESINVCFKRLINDSSNTIKDFRNQIKHYKMK